MKNLDTVRSSSVVRVGTFLLSLILVSAAFWTSLVTVANWDDLWSGGNYYESNRAVEDSMHYVNDVHRLLELRIQKEQGKLNYTNQELLKELEEKLDPTVTNFRYQLHDDSTGEELGGNLAGAVLENVAAGIRMGQFDVVTGADLSEEDKMGYEPERDEYYLTVKTAEGTRHFYASDAPETFNEYGYYSNGYSWRTYSQEQDSRIQRQTIAMEFGIAKPAVVEDDFTESMASYETLQRRLPLVAGMALVLIALAVCSIGCLCKFAGHREGEPGIVLTWLDRIPYDVYLTLYFFILVALLSAGDSITYNFGLLGLRPLIAAGLGVFTLLIAGVSLAAIHTTAVRLKNRSLLHNTVLCAFFRAVVRGCRGMVHNWSVTRRIVWLFLLYLVGTVVTGLTLILIPVYQGFVLWCLCRWLRQWKAIRAGTAEIVGGNPDFKIDTSKMYRDLREHAEQLNDLGSAIGSAVDERMKSERMKAELITNVSHDLKTPLTSIINYVDLLKKTEIQDQKALEYIEVLDRKSMRLKKLTEDLVEASKASTGNLTVNRERLGMSQLVLQALAEYEDRFEGRGLEVVPRLPEHECFVQADGRHLWRVIDNLLSNCNKYAMPGTRIYLEVCSWDGNVHLTVKNVSSQALNIPPDQLMERFVRGEESRSTEGSGLGLSIARSLTELQGGVLRIDIDGDLFKVTVTFPEDVEPLPLPPLMPEFGTPDSGAEDDGNLAV